MNKEKNVLNVGVTLIYKYTTYITKKINYLGNTLTMLSWYYVKTVTKRNMNYKKKLF